MPDRAKKWPGLLLLLIGTAAFITLALDVHFKGQLARIDHPLHKWLYENSNHTIVLICSILSGAGEFKILLPLGLAVGGYMLYRRQYWPTALWAIALLGSMILNLTLKNNFQIPRPDRYTFYVFKPNSGYSFPSGHTQGAAIAICMLALLGSRLAWWSRRTACWIWILAIFLSILVAGALLTVGVHLLTDVLAGLAVAMAWVGFCIFLATLKPLTPRRTPG